MPRWAWLVDQYNQSMYKCVRMAEWSKALRSGRSPLLWAWVRIPLLTNIFYLTNIMVKIYKVIYLKH